MSLVPGSPELDAALQTCLTRTAWRGRVTSIELLAKLCLMQPRGLLVFFVVRTRCWLPVSLLATRTPRSFTAKLLLSWPIPSLSCCLGLSLPRSRTLNFPLLNFTRFLSAHFSSMPRSLWMAEYTSAVSDTPPGFVLSANLLSVHYAPTLRPLMKMLNSSGPSIKPWGTLLVTGIQLDLVLWITELWAWQFSHFPVHLTVHLSNLYFIILPARILFEAMPKALLK